MKTINNFLSEYIKMIGGNNNISKDEKINNLIEQITGDGSKIQEKKIISIKVNQLTGNNINELENQDEFKKYLLSLKKSSTSTVHQFYSSENEF
jgi:hypothetical protein